MEAGSGSAVCGMTRSFGNVLSASQAVRMGSVVRGADWSHLNQHIHSPQRIN